MTRQMQTRTPRQVRQCLHFWKANDLHHQCQYAQTSRDHAHLCACGAKDDQRVNA